GIHQEGRDGVEAGIDPLGVAGAEQGDVLVVEEGEPRLELLAIGRVAAVAAVGQKLIGKPRLATYHEAPLDEGGAEAGQIGVAVAQILGAAGGEEDGIGGAGGELEGQFTGEAGKESRLQPRGLHFGGEHRRQESPWQQPQQPCPHTIPYTSPRWWGRQWRSS